GLLLAENQPYAERAPWAVLAPAAVLALLGALAVSAAGGLRRPSRRRPARTPGGGEKDDETGRRPVPAAETEPAGAR
ncbi:hypothetical protein AB0J75_33105, partial [Streptomyces sp. NPDC049744]